MDFFDMVVTEIIVPLGAGIGYFLSYGVPFLVVVFGVTLILRCFGVV